MKELEQLKDKYLYLFADCFPVKGYTRTMLCDVSRQKVYFIDNSYHELLMELKDKTIGMVAAMLDDDEDLINFKEFMDYLTEIELAIIVDDISVFPSMELEWDHPSQIVNAIIDIRNEIHDFDKIFKELDVLGCYDIQIRAYCSMSVKQIRSILSFTEDKNFRSIEFLVEHDFNNKGIATLLTEYPIANITYHSYAKKSATNKTSKTKPEEHGAISYTEQKVNSCEGCGLINMHSLGIRNVKGFTENIKYNGCLNRKISIDETGFVKNCPSMQKNYGHVTSTSLTAVAGNEQFQKLWGINKDSIDTCKDCEFRYICTDCRAYTMDGDLFSKPKKCQYDPYTGKWANDKVAVNTVFA